MAKIEVKWKKMGPEFTYSIMYSKSADGPWIRANDYRVTDDTETPVSSQDENVFYIDNLRNDEQYYIKVLSHDKYHQWWYSYSGKDSLEGGLSSDSLPIPNGNNTLGIQFEVI